MSRPGLAERGHLARKSFDWNLEMVCNALDMNQHRWVEWIESGDVAQFLLGEARKWLKTAWESDRKGGYPLSTSHVLAQIRNVVSPTRPPRPRVTRMPKPKPRQTLADLAPERLVRRIWEDNHSGTLNDAIRAAGQMDFDNQEKPWRAFQGIMQAMEGAYWVSFFGPEILPKPKVSILHRGLKQIAIAVGLESAIQYAEFFDDLCPCGLKNHREAVRKMESRSGRYRQAPNAESKKELGKKDTSKHKTKIHGTSQADAFGGQTRPHTQT